MGQGPVLFGSMLTTEWSAAMSRSKRARRARTMPTAHEERDPGLRSRAPAHRTNERQWLAERMNRRR